MDLDEYRNNLLPSERSLFDEVVEIGIRKTIDALLDADVDDSVMQHVVFEHWGVSQKDFRDILVQEKINAALYLLRQHLELQNYTSSEISKLLSSLAVKPHLIHNHELLKQWKNPEKILKTLQKKSK